MVTSEFINIASPTEFQKNKRLNIVLEGDVVTFFEIEGTVIAMVNSCPHQQYPVLHEGVLKGNTLTCPRHGWSFDLISGKTIIGSFPLKKIMVNVQGDDIRLERPDTVV